MIKGDVDMHLLVHRQLSARRQRQAERATLAASARRAAGDGRWWRLLTWMRGEPAARPCTAPSGCH